MNNFDLRKVHDLILFQDVCTTDNEYMTEASSLPRVELVREALYVLTPEMPKLFTPKLRYYRLIVENEINRHINAATELLKADGTEQLTKYVLKKTREAVATLVNEAKRLTILDIEDNTWKNITIEKPSIPRHIKKATELAVYSHYVIAELARCWLELQDRYAYVIGEAGCYDVSLFYTSIVGRNPDKEFELKRLVKYEEEAKGFKKGRPSNNSEKKQEKQHGVEYPVFSKGSGVTDDHIKALYRLLTARGWICTQTKEVDFQRLFSGEANDCEIIWTGQDKLGNNKPTHLGISALYVLFMKMADDKQITTGNKSKRVGPILESHFVDTQGRFLTNISNVSSTSQVATAYIGQILKTMRLRPSSEDIQRLLQEDMESKYDENNRQDLNYRKPH